MRIPSNLETSAARTRELSAAGQVQGAGDQSKAYVLPDGPIRGPAAPVPQANHGQRAAAAVGIRTKAGDEAWKVRTTFLEALVLGTNRPPDPKLAQRLAKEVLAQRNALESAHKAAESTKTSTGAVNLQELSKKFPEAAKVVVELGEKLAGTKPYAPSPFPIAMLALEFLFAPMDSVTFDPRYGSEWVGYRMDSNPAGDVFLKHVSKPRKSRSA